MELWRAHEIRKIHDWRLTIVTYILKMRNQKRILVRSESQCPWCKQIHHRCAPESMPETTICPLMTPLLRRKAHWEWRSSRSDDSLKKHGMAWMWDAVPVEKGWREKKINLMKTCRGNISAKRGEFFIECEAICRIIIIIFLHYDKFSLP